MAWYWIVLIALYACGAGLVSFLASFTWDAKEPSVAKCLFIGLMWPLILLGVPFVLLYEHLTRGY